MTAYKKKNELEYFYQIIYNDLDNIIVIQLFDNING